MKALLSCLWQKSVLSVWNLLEIRVKSVPAEIVPAIIAKDFEELKRKTKLVEPYVNWVQLDVMDGKFAPEETWPYSTGSDPTELKNLKQNFNLETHLMIEEPEKIIDKWINSGVKRILVHVESLISKLKTQNSNLQLKCQNLANRCKERDIEFGLVLNLETSIEVLDDLVFIIHNSKFIIQLMSIAQIGYHGHPFDEKVIHKIKALREKYPDVKIAVDGGVNESTARKATEAGADILVVGSAIFDSENVENAIKRLEKIYV